MESTDITIDERDDRELVEQAQLELPNGTTAFRALVVRYTPTIYRRSYRILRSEADADDAVQDVFLSVLRALPAFRPERPFSHWLSVITLNACRRILRRRAAEDRRRDGLSEHLELGEARADRDPILHDVLAELLDTLPPTTRVALIMRVLEERAYSEIAEELGMKESAVKMRISRACKSLKDLFEARAVRGNTATPGLAPALNA